MARYKVKFEIEVVVDEPSINAGCSDEVVYNDCGHQTITDEQWNEIVSDAVDQMKDIQNSVVEIIKEEDDDDYENDEEVTD